MGCLFRHQQDVGLSDTAKPILPPLPGVRRGKILRSRIFRKWISGMEKEIKEDSYSKRLTFRLTNPEWETLASLLKKSRHRSASELVRTMLFSGKVTVIIRDESLHNVMEQLSAVRTEIHRIGVNINQITGRFHREKFPEARLLQVLEVQRLHQEMGRKVEELFKLITNISYRWLPE